MKRVSLPLDSRWKIVIQTIPSPPPPPCTPCHPFIRVQVLRKWVSRFDLWPYVEQYTLDVQREIMAGERGVKCAGGLLHLGQPGPGPNSVFIISNQFRDGGSVGVTLGASHVCMQPCSAAPS